MHNTTEEIKTAKRLLRAVRCTFVTAALPIAAALGYGFYRGTRQFLQNVQTDGLILTLIPLLFSLFVCTVWGIVLSCIWFGVCVYRPMKRYVDFFHHTIFPRAILCNPDYQSVRICDENIFSEQQLVADRVILRGSFSGIEFEETILGQYRQCGFTISSFKSSNHSGTIGVYDNCPIPSLPTNFLKILCASPSNFPTPEQLEQNKLQMILQNSLADYRELCILTDKNVHPEEAELAVWTGLAAGLAHQLLDSFSITYVEGTVAFILEASGLLIPTSVFQSLEKQILTVETDGIKEVTLFVTQMEQVFGGME